jgi:acetyl esterase/lipase
MKRNIILTLLLLSITAFACDPSSDTKLTDVSYGKHNRQKLDIALPTTANDQNAVPFVLCIHGGSWSSGDKADFDWVKKRLLDYGYAYVTINYRLIQDGATYVDMLEDINSAISFIKKNNKKYHLKNDKIALIGSSAGGHLALLYTYKKNSPIDIVFVTSMSGPTDFTDDAFRTNISDYGLLNKLTGTNITLSQLQSPNFTFPSQWIDASPVHYVANNVAPTIMAYGMMDQLVPYSNALHLDQLLTQHNILHTFISYPNSGHDLKNDPDKANELNQKFQEALDSYLPK